MANGVKEYKIVINGVKESINAVDSLNKQLDDLEKRMNALNSKGVNVSTPKGGDSYKGELDAQEKLEKQILATEEKLAQVRDENYKKLLHMKEELKEYTQIAKSQVASEANQQGLFDTNTMAGMKAQLKSIKQEMQTVEIGGDRFKELTGQANELNNKLKEIEQSYGQYGRNVGNYANSIAEGVEKLKIDVNGVTQEFDTAKQAMKTLRNEMQTLSTKKDMGIITKEEEERLKGLIPVVKQLESSIADAGKPMDALLDTMQSVMAIASVGQGIGALFGMDDGEIEKTIQKLVALQNVMQGLQVLQNQMQSGEGIGGWLAKGNAAIDKMVASMFGLTTATKGATVATKALGVALKAIGIGLIVAAIAELINLYKQWSDTQEKAAKEAEEAAAKIKKSVDDQRNAFVNASAQYMNTASRLSQLRAEYMSTNNQLKKTAIIEEASAEFKKLGISVNSVGDAQRILVNQGGAVIAMIQEQGNAAAYAALRMEAFKKSFNMLLENGYDVQAAASLASYNKQVVELDKLQTKSNANIAKYQKQLGISNEKAIKENNRKATKTTVDGVKELNELRINMMKEGLRKTITQLEEERKQMLAKLDKNVAGYKKYEEEINKLYDAKILEERENWAKEMIKSNRDMWHQIYEDDLENLNRAIQLTEQQTELYRERQKGVRSDDYKNQSISSYGIQGKGRLSPTTSFSLGIASNNQSQLIQDTKQLMDLAREAQAAANRLMATQIEYKRTVDTLTEEEKAEYEEDIKNYKAYYDEKQVILNEWKSKMAESTEYTNEMIEGAWKALSDESYSSSLAVQFEQAISLTEKFWQQRIGLEMSQSKKLYDQKVKARNEEYIAEQREAKEHNDSILDQAEENYQKQIDGLKGLLENKKITQEEYDRDYQKALKDRNDAIDRENAAWFDKSIQLEEKYTQDLKEIEYERNNSVRDINKEAYEARLQELRDFYTAISNLESKTPIAKNALGFIDIKKNRENNTKLYDAYEASARKIIELRVKVNKEYKDGLIDEDTFRSTLRELDNFSADLGDKMEAVKRNMSFGEVFSQMAQQINEYMQYLGSQLNSLMQSIWQFQDSLYEKQMEELEKHIDKYEELLQKQEEITEQHRNKVESIEDELATSRGDRRQHLIDQLNEEIAAQRRSAAEEKKLEKEKKKAEAQKEKEEQKRREREHKREVQQAFISWHLSIANALAVQPWFLGLAMASVATTLGAIQYALVKNSKYADGGVIVGKSHKDGGVPVLGGRAEVEGNEFITNKVTTQKNTDLLYYINSKKRKLDINDFIEFYSGKGGKKAITQMSPRGKFADGGVMSPVLDDSVKVDNRILNALEHYAERPYYVTVTDIENKMDDVNYVRTLAGVE